MERAENNYLYIAENKKGIVKIGVTKNNPYERVESFSQYYTDKFNLVTFFNIKNMNRIDVETFFHEILNSQFLNINYLAKTMIKINDSHAEIVNKKLNGYTELFVENKVIIRNLLIFLNLIDVIDLKIYDIDEINKIKSYTLGDVKNFQKFHKENIRNEFNKASIIKPLIGNKQQLLLKNARYFFKDLHSTDFKHLSFEISENDIFFKLKDKKLSITNFIYSNLDLPLTQSLIKTKTYKNVYFKNLVNHIANLRILNKRVSTQFKSDESSGVNTKQLTTNINTQNYNNNSELSKPSFDNSDNKSSYPRKNYSEGNKPSFDNSGNKTPYPRKNYSEGSQPSFDNSGNKTPYPRKNYSERNKPSFDNSGNKIPYPRKNYSEPSKPSFDNSDNKSSYPRKNYSEKNQPFANNNETEKSQISNKTDIKYKNKNF